MLRVLYAFVSGQRDWWRDSVSANHLSLRPSMHYGQRGFLFAEISLGFVRANSHARISRNQLGGMVYRLASWCMSLRPASASNKSEWKWRLVGKSFHPPPTGGSVGCLEAIHQPPIPLHPFSSSTVNYKLECWRCRFACSLYKSLAAHCNTDTQLTCLRCAISIAITSTVDVAEVLRTARPWQRRPGAMMVPAGSSAVLLQCHRRPARWLV